MNTDATIAKVGPAPALGPDASRRLRWHFAAAAALMLACLAIAIWIKPSKFWSDEVGEPALQALVPKSFGDFVESPYGAQTVVNPQQEEGIRAIYSNTLARVFIHKPTGRQLMLSLAYGKDQSRDTQLHVPDACYGANGFRIQKLQPVDIAVGQVTLPATRMEATMGPRQEFVTYWIRVGDQLARGSLQRNLIRMRFATRGYIADGLLFRVSEVTRARAEDSYELQDRFMRELLASVPKAEVHGFIGQQQL